MDTEDQLNDLIVAAADRNRRYVEEKTDAVRGYNDACLTYVNELRRCDAARDCIRAWEGHNVKLMAQTAPPIQLEDHSEVGAAIASPERNPDSESNLERIANDLAERVGLGEIARRLVG